MRRNSLIAVSIVLAIVLAGVLYARARYGAINIPLKAEPHVSTSTAESLADFSLPQGFSMHVFAKDIPGARVMALDPAGTLLVSQPSQGQIVALTDSDGDGLAEKRSAVITRLGGPHGLAFDCASGQCTLYIAEEDAVL